MSWNFFRCARMPDELLPTLTASCSGLVFVGVAACAAGAASATAAASAASGSARWVLLVCVPSMSRRYGRRAAQRKSRGDSVTHRRAHDVRHLGGALEVRQVRGVLEHVRA